MARIEPLHEPQKPGLLGRWIERLRETLRPIPEFRKGTGTPEGAVNGMIGDRFYRTDGTAGTRLYVKTSDGGNTGWVAYA